MQVPRPPTHNLSSNRQEEKGETTHPPAIHKLSEVSPPPPPCVCGKRGETSAIINTSSSLSPQTASNIRWRLSPFPHRTHEEPPSFPSTLTLTFTRTPPPKRTNDRRPSRPPAISTAPYPYVGAWGAREAADSLNKYSDRWLGRSFVRARVWTLFDNTTHGKDPGRGGAEAGATWNERSAVLNQPT